MSGLSVDHFALRPQCQQGSNDLETKLSQKRNGDGDDECSNDEDFANESIFCKKIDFFA